jgi:hypothetical protein
MAHMAKITGPILLKGFDDCLLGIAFPRAVDRKAAPFAVYSADMIAARMRDRQGMTDADARSFVADVLEQAKLGPATPQVVWAATAIDLGVEPDADEDARSAA